MALFTVPIATSVPSFRQRTTLDGREYVLVFRWSQLESRWFLDILDAQENVLASSIKIVANWPLLDSRRFSQALPPGELVAVDRRKPAKDPGLDELGGVVPLVYVNGSDLAAIGVAA